MASARPIRPALVLVTLWVTHHSFNVPGAMRRFASRTMDIHCTAFTANHCSTMLRIAVQRRVRSPVLVTRGYKRRLRAIEEPVTEYRQAQPPARCTCSSIGGHDVAVRFRLCWRAHHDYGEAPHTAALSRCSSHSPIPAQSLGTANRKTSASRANGLIGSPTR